MKEKYRHPQFSTKGLVAYYKLFTPTVDGSNVFDYSGGGFTGAVSGAFPAYPGFSFDGTNDKITFASGPSSVKTVVAWVNVTGPQTKGIVDLNGVDYIDFNTAAVALVGFVGGTNIVYVDSVATTTLGTDWAQVVVTSTTARDASAGSMEIGNSLSDFWNGLIGETMLFDRVLTQVEIKNIYEITKWRYPNNN